MTALINRIGNEIGFACDFIMTAVILTSLLLVVDKLCGTL